MAAWRLGQDTWRPLPRKDAALLARLALEGRQARTRMAVWLWPEVPLPRAHANLRQRLYRLRQQAGPLIDEAGEGLQLATGVACDLWREGCADDADFAATLLAGPADASDAVQAWLDDARQQWLARRTDVMSGLAAQHEAAGQLAAALALTERLLALDPLLEHAWRRLMRLHAQRGDRAAAVAAFERCERVLRDDLGLRPSPETQALLHQVETFTTPGAPACDAPTGASSVAPPPAPPLPAALLRPPRLVGRAAEQQAMRAAWEAGAAFVLVAEAGLGKSRLLLDLAAAGPGRVIEAARPGDEGVPYAALVRLLRTMSRVASRPESLWPDASAAADERRELARLLPELGQAPAAPGLEALLVGALEQVFRRAPSAGLQALLVDDLQHADEATRAVLQRCAAQPGLRWGFATRPDPQGATAAWLGSSARVHAVRLQPLAGEAMAELLDACALPGLDTARLAPALARHCGGNPLFVLETLRQWLLDAAQRGQAPGAALPLPPSVESVLAQRLAALSSPAQALARVAAVAGADFNAEVAADVLGQPLLSLAEPWGELETTQVLRGGAFAHDTLREAVLRSLPTALRAPLHARVARSLRQHGAPPRRVADHFTAGGLPAEAAASAMAAAAECRRLGQLAGRVARLIDAEQAYTMAGQAAQALEARLEIPSARFALEGPTPEVRAMVDGLLAQAPERKGRVYLQLLRAGLALAAFDLPDARNAARDALAEAEPETDDELSAVLLMAAAMVLSGDAGAAVALAQPLLPRLQTCADALLATNLWGYLAMVYAQAGRTDEGISALQSQRRLAREVGKADDEATALTSLVGAYGQRGELSLALALGREALAMQRRMGAGHGVIGALLNLALAQVGSHALRDALVTLAEAREALQAQGVGGELAWITDDIEAEVWLRTAQPQRALGLTGDDATAGTVSEPRRTSRQTLRARALSALGRPDEAQTLWRQVLAAAPGPVLVQRAQLLAVCALGGAADERLSPLVAAAAGQPPPMQAIVAWVTGEVACRGGDAAAGLTAARQLRALLPRARQSSLPEAQARAWLCKTLSALAPEDEAHDARAETRQWCLDVVLPGLPEGAASAWQAVPLHRRLLAG